LTTKTSALVVGMRKAGVMLDCGDDALYGHIKNGDLDSFLDGNRRKITVESIERLIEKRLAADPGKLDRAPAMRKLRARRKPQTEAAA
jgi:hypothetical protein